jgi:hypothetical protein
MLSQYDLRSYKEMLSQYDLRSYKKKVELVGFVTLETNVCGISKAISRHPDARIEPTPQRMLFHGITSRIQNP